MSGQRLSDWCVPKVFNRRGENNPSPLLRSGTCRALGVSEHEIIQRTPTTEFAKSGQGIGGTLDQSASIPALFPGNSLRDCADASGLRVHELTFHRAIHRCCDHTAGKRKPFPGADAAISSERDRCNKHKRRVDSEWRAGRKRFPWRSFRIRILFRAAGSALARESHCSGGEQCGSAGQRIVYRESER